MTRAILNLPMASRSAAPASPVIQGHHKDPIQLHAEAHNSVALAAYYVAKGNTPAARRKLTQALSALRALDLVGA